MSMPIGAFLDTLPASLYIVVHAALLLVGLWAVKNAKKKNLKYASAFLLYVLVHVGFLAYFGGLFTLKMSVLLEQMLMVAMVLWISKKA